MGQYSACHYHFFSTYSRGAVAGSNTPEATDRCVVLKEEVKDLEDYEKLIDQHKNVRCLHTHFFKIIAAQCFMCFTVGSAEHQERDRGHIQRRLQLRFTRGHLRLLQWGNLTGHSGSERNTARGSHPRANVSTNTGY